MTDSELVHVPDPPASRRGVADAVTGVAATAGIGGSTVAAVAGASWWVVAPAALISAASGLVAMGGRTVDLWHRIGRVIEDRSLRKAIQWNCARLLNASLSRDERQQLLEEIAAMRRLLGRHL